MHSEDHHQSETRKKPGNTLPIWGNTSTMNINSMVHTNVLGSPYFKNQLIKLKTYHEVVDEIYYKVDHLEPWEKGSRKTSGQVGMCGGVRGVGAGGIVSTAFCLLFKLFTLKLTRKQLKGLLDHPDSPFIRGLGFMYIRYCQPPQDYWHWYEEYLEDEEELDVKSGSGCVMTIGQMVRSFMLKLDWYGTLFPRIPVPIQKDLQNKLSEANLCDDHKRKADEGWGEAERYSKGVREEIEEDTNGGDRKTDTGRHQSRDRSPRTSRDEKSSSRHRDSSRRRSRSRDGSHRRGSSRHRSRSRDSSRRRDSPRHRSHSRDRSRRRNSPKRRSHSRDGSHRRNGSRERRRSRSHDSRSSKRRSRSRERNTNRDRSRARRSSSNERHRSDDHDHEKRNHHSPVNDRKVGRSNSRDRLRKRDRSRSPSPRSNREDHGRLTTQKNSPPEKRERQDLESTLHHDVSINTSDVAVTGDETDDQHPDTAPLTDEFGRDIRPSNIERTVNSRSSNDKITSEKESRVSGHDEQEKRSQTNSKKSPQSSILHGNYNSDSGEETRERKRKDDSLEDGELIDRKKKKKKKEKKSKKNKKEKRKRQSESE